MEQELRKLTNDKIHLYISNSKYFDTDTFPYMLYWHTITIQNGFEVSKDFLKVKSYKFSAVTNDYREGETKEFDSKEQTLEYLKKELKIVCETL